MDLTSFITINGLKPDDDSKIFVQNLLDDGKITLGDDEIIYTIQGAVRRGETLKICEATGSQLAKLGSVEASVMMTMNLIALLNNVEIGQIATLKQRDIANLGQLLAFFAMA